jgi:hypothetical protein
MSQYKCCDIEFSVSKVTVKIVNDETMDHDSTNGEPIICSKCGKNLRSIPNEIGMTFIPKFSRMNSKERGDMLDKRSKEHFKREGKEMKVEKLKKAGLSYE